MEDNTVKLSRGHHFLEGDVHHGAFVKYSWQSLEMMWLRLSMLGICDSHGYNVGKKIEIFILITTRACAAEV